MIAWLGARVDAALGGVATPEARLAVTAGIVLLTVAVGWLVLPRVVNAVERVERFDEDGGRASDRPV